MLKSKKVLIALATVAAVSVTAFAAAAWLSGGSGAAYSTADTAKDLTTGDISATVKADLYPGASAAASIEIVNPNPYPIRITNVKGNGAVTPDSAHAAGCVTTGVSFADQSGLTIDIPANGSTQAELAGAVSMTNASDNGCQGAKFTIPVTFTGGSNAS
jgi:hypothetical protein